MDQQLEYNYSQRDRDYGNLCAKKFWNGQYSLQSLITALKNDGKVEVNDQPFRDYAYSCTKNPPFSIPDGLWPTAMQVLIIGFIFIGIEDNLNTRHFNGRLDSSWNREYGTVNFWLE